MKLLLFVVFINLTISCEAFCQKNILVLKGTVLHKDKRLTDVLVNIYTKSDLIESVKTNNRGKFTLKLTGKNNYTVEFKKEGYFDRQMIFSAHPKNDFGRERFSFEINMFKIEEDKTPVEVTKIPLIEYIPNEKQFKFTQNL